MRHDPQVQRAVAGFQLGLPRMPVSGRAGELLGRGTGSSLEFQEYREYMPGDDIRHLDWAAYARSDTLMVRLYREEISPRLQILLDASRSMTTSRQKSLVARQLAALFTLLSGQLGGRPNLVPLDDNRPPRRWEAEGLDLLESLPFNGRATLSDLLAENAVFLTQRSVRIVISDFLFPHDPESLIKRLAGDATVLWVIQLLGEWEAEPTTLGGRKLTDVETAAESDLILDPQTVAGYRRRLKQLQEELARNCRRVQARFVTLVAERGLASLCRGELTTAEMLRPI